MMWKRIYGVPFSEISVTLKNITRWSKTNASARSKVNAREFFQTIAEIQFESGYPYVMFEDTVNRMNPIDGPHQHVEPVLRNPSGERPRLNSTKTLVTRKMGNGYFLQPWLSQHCQDHGWRRSGPHCWGLDPGADGGV